MNAHVALWSSIVFGASAQVFLRKGVMRKEQHNVSYLSLLASPWVWAWALFFAFATLLWLLALARIDVSYAFPILSSGFPLVAILSIVFLKERISPGRWLAILVITAGVAIIWRAA